MRRFLSSFQLVLVLMLCVFLLGCVQSTTPPVPAPTFQRNASAIETMFANIDAGRGLTSAYPSSAERSSQYRQVFANLQAFKAKYPNFSMATPEQLSQDLGAVLVEPIKLIRRALATKNALNADAPTQPVDGNIVIPPYSMVEWSTKGNCMDPSLPAPRGGDAFQLTSVDLYIEPELMPIYQCIMDKSGNDPYIQQHQQKLVWALRTVNSADKSYADSLSAEQLQVFNECMANGAEVFKDTRRSAASKAKLQNSVRNFLKNTLGSVTIAGTNYNFGDMIFDGSDNQVEDHLAALTNMPIDEALKDDGFEFGQIDDDVYTHAVGNGTLSLDIRIVNASGEPYTINPTNFVAHPQRKAQRVSLSPPSSVRFTSLANRPLAEQMYAEDVNEIAKFIEEFTPHLKANLKEGFGLTLLGADIAVRAIDKATKELFGDVDMPMTSVKDLKWYLFSNMVQSAKKHYDPQATGVAKDFVDAANALIGG